MTPKEREILSIWFPSAVTEGRNIPGADRDAACARMREQARRDIPAASRPARSLRVVDEEIDHFRRIVAKWNRQT